MKYSLDDTMTRIEEKSKKMIYQKKLKEIRILTVTTLLALIAFGAALWKYIGFSAIDGTYSKYGSFMLPDEAGGYIIVGVLCFVLAVVITILCFKFKNKENENNNGKEL